MPEAKVNIKETDVSTRVVGSGDVYAGICIHAAKGPIEGATLITSIDELYKYFTTDNILGSGWDIAYESAKAFLSKGRFLWVKRVIGDTDSVGGLFFPASAIASAPSDFSEVYTSDAQVSAVVDNAPVADKNFAIFSKDPGEWGNNISVDIIPYVAPTACVTNGLAVVTENVGAESADSIAIAKWEGTMSWACGKQGTQTVPGTYDSIEYEEVNVSVFKHSNGVATPYTALKVKTTAVEGQYEILEKGVVLNTAWVKKSGSDGYQLFSKVNGVIDGAYTFEALYTQVDTYADLPATPTLHDEVLVKTAGTHAGEEFPANTVFECTDATAGAVVWGIVEDPDKIEVTISALDSEAAGTADSYTIIVKDNVKGTVLENWKVSNGRMVKDGYGKTLFVETKLASSNYIHACVHVNNGANKPNASFRDFALVNGAGSPTDTVAVSKYVSAANVFISKEDYPCRLLLDGGQTDVAYQKKLENIAKTRKDCVAILSSPAECEKSLDPKGAVVNYRNNVLNMNSSYAAMFTPHLSILSEDSGQRISVAPDGFYAAALAETAANSEVWYPAAGLTRGVLSNVLDVDVRYSEGDRDYLVDNQINPIRFYAGSGIVIWGNKTLKSQASALQSLHIRLLLTVIEPAMAEALETLLFDLNDEATRTIARTLCDTYMDNIQARRGVTQKLVICDETNNTALDLDSGMLNVTVSLIPTGSVETINLNIVVSSNSISVETAANLI